MGKSWVNASVSGLSTVQYLKVGLDAVGNRIRSRACVVKFQSSIIGFTPPTSASQPKEENAHRKGKVYADIFANPPTSSCRPFWCTVATIPFSLCCALYKTCSLQTAPRPRRREGLVRACQRSALAALALFCPSQGLRKPRSRGQGSRCNHFAAR